MSILSVRNLHVRLGEAHVLQGVSLDVAEGSVTALLGRNGAGKSTTLKTIMGWHTAAEGSVELEGKAINRLASDRIARMGVGFIPEDRRIFTGLSVEENLRIGLFQKGLSSRSEAERGLQRMFEWFPRLGERRAQSGKTLSGGEQQMLSIARGLIGAPRLVLIDEPTEGLAPMIVKEIFAAILEMKRQGLSVLVVEQNVRGVMKVSDRCVVIDRGRTVASGTPQELEGNETIQRKLAVA